MKNDQAIISMKDYILFQELKKAGKENVVTLNVTSNYNSDTSYNGTNQAIAKLTKHLDQMAESNNYET